MPYTHNPENVTAVLIEAATNNNLLTNPPRIAAQMFLEAADNQSSFTSVKKETISGINLNTQPYDS